MLSALIWLPVIGALAITLLPQSQSKKRRNYRCKCHPYPRCVTSQAI